MHTKNNSLKRTDDLYEYIDVPLCKSESLSPKILNANWFRNWDAHLFGTLIINLSFNINESYPQYFQHLTFESDRGLSLKRLLHSLWTVFALKYSFKHRYLNICHVSTFYKKLVRLHLNSPWCKQDWSSCYCYHWCVAPQRSLISPHYDLLVGMWLMELHLKLSFCDYFEVMCAGNFVPLNFESCMVLIMVRDSK